MDYTLEVVTLAVTDVDAAIDFYTRLAGFRLDVDYQPGDTYRVVQLTPPGSACSIQFGAGLTDAAPGAARSTHLVVTDIETAHHELRDRGAPVGPVRRKTSVDDWQGDHTPGVDPHRRDYASSFTFADPDGNTWTVQERGRPHT